MSSDRLTPTRSAARRTLRTSIVGAAVIACGATANAQLVGFVPPIQRASPPAWRAPGDKGRALTPNERIRFTPAAREQLAVLWNASIAAHSERVACLGGQRDTDGAVEVLRVEPVPTEGADFANAPAAASLARCRPSAWLGTVHTHIATAQGIPYVTFSAPDRDVIARWEARFGMQGVFCIVYTDRDAYCEAGPTVSGEVRYRETAAAGDLRARCTAALAVLSASRRCRADAATEPRGARR
jgi:hypothetical protein